MTRNAKALELRRSLPCPRADSEPGPAARLREALRSSPARHRAPPAAPRSLRLDRRHEHARQCAAVAANGGEFRRHGDQRRRVPVNRAQCHHQKAVSCHDALREDNTCARKQAPFLRGREVPPRELSLKSCASSGRTGGISSMRETGVPSKTSSGSASRRRGAPLGPWDFVHLPTRHRPRLSHSLTGLRR